MATIEGYQSAEEALKVAYRPIFLAFQDVFRSWPGGASDAFRVLDWNPGLALVQMSPNDYEHGPSLLRFLRLVEYMQPRRVVHEIAGLAGCATVPGFRLRAAPASSGAAADSLAAALRKVLYELDAMAGKPSQAEAAEFKADLFRLIDAAHVMAMRLNG